MARDAAAAAANFKQLVAQLDEFVTRVKSSFRLSLALLSLFIERK